MVMFDGDEIELIDNFLPPDVVPRGINKSIWYKGLAIKKLAECTHICVLRKEEFYEGHQEFYEGPQEFYEGHQEFYRGCYIEQKVAELYNIEMINLGNFSLYCPDLSEDMRRTTIIDSYDPLEK